MLSIFEFFCFFAGTESSTNTSAEDQQAIRDIQQQLQNLEYIPGMELSPHSHSPLTPLTNVPAIASNPSNTTALMTIDHRPVPGSDMSENPYSLPGASPPMNSIRSQLGEQIYTHKMKCSVSCI